MSRKSNFLINFSTDNIKFDADKAGTLSNYYDIKTGNIIIELNYSDNAVFAKSNDKNVIILLSGNIYNDDIKNYKSKEEFLLDKYSLYKKDFVKYLNGSFCLFFAQIDTGDFYFATDRLNTRKIYKYEHGKITIFSTDINYLPLNECTLCYAGAASYLINGVMLNDLTIYNEIKKLGRSSLHKIEGTKIISQKYWDYNFTNEYSNRSESELSVELHNLYLKSLNRIITGKKNIYISLSGGYDSRGIAAMVKNISDSKHSISCLSHNFGNNIQNTDSDIARQTAEKLGLQFNLLNSYNGDLFHTFKKNSELGNGMASFCIELDAWEQINIELEKIEDSVFLVGDMYDGTYVAFHGNIKRALEKAHICEPSFLKEYKYFLSDEVYKCLYENWNIEYNKIINTVSLYDNMVNLLDYLYMDQLIPNLYGIERESFHMPFIETVSPFYDNDILDFIQKLPSDLRNRKKLHKVTLEKYYQDVFSIKFPTEGWGSEPVWINEIRKFANVFIDDIKKHKSKLDKIIPPESIINSLLSYDEKNTNIYQGKSALRLLHKTLNKVIPSYHRIIEIFPGGDEFTRKAGKYINPRISHPLIKILILRLFLSIN